MNWEDKDKVMKTMLLKKEDIYKGDLILINKKHPIRINEQETINNLDVITNQYRNHLMIKNAANTLSEILNKINSKDKIIPVSGFRTKSEQKNLYKSSVIDNGIDFTEKYVAKPNESEHQSGMAIDLGQNKENVDFICPDFPYHGIYQKFRRESIKWGFIERYKEGKEHITGIAKEPWHFRYVGYPHSAIIEGKGFALEEYHDFIKQYTSLDNAYEYMDNKRIMKIFFIKSTGDNVILNIENNFLCKVSGNNSDGYIVTMFNNL